MRMILKDSEIGTCISALDFYSRMYMGQYGEIDFELRQYRFDSELIINICLPGSIYIRQ